MGVVHCGYSVSPGTTDAWAIGLLASTGRAGGWSLCLRKGTTSSASSPARELSGMERVGAYKIRPGQAEKPAAGVRAIPDVGLVRFVLTGGRGPLGFKSRAR